MKTALISTAAAFALVGLSACDRTDSPEVPANEAVQAETAAATTKGRDIANSLLTDSFTATNDGAISVDALSELAAAMPGTAKFTFGETVQTDTGALQVKDFAFTFMVEEIEVGLKAETADFWGFNGDALSARVNGTNLSETVKLADRITLSNISSVGFDELGELMAQEYNDSLATTIDPSGEMISPADMMVIRDYDIRADKLVLDGLTLAPYQVTYTQDEDIDAESLDGIHLLQGYAAASRAFSLEGFALSNAEFVIDMAAAEEGMSMNMTVPVTVMSGYDRGNIDYIAYYDSTFDMKGAFPVEDAGFEDSTLKLDMTGGIKAYEVSNLGLANVYRAVSEWELPEHTEADFMSLGNWRLEGYTFDMNEQRVFNADLIALDLTEFHWLLPTKVNLDVDGFAYEIATLMDSVFEMMPEGEVSEEELAQMRSVVDVLNRNNLGCLCGDLEITAAWNEDTGALTYNEAGNFADLFSGKANFDMTIVTPAQVAAIIAEEIEEDTFETGLIGAFEFRSFLWQITDTGGLDAIAKTAHEIGETFPDEPGMAMLAYNDADALRGLAVNMVNGFGPELIRELPEARPWLDAVATWLEEGGTLSFELNPPRPINMEIIEGFEDAEPTPSEMAELVGASVTHTPN